MWDAQGKGPLLTARGEQLKSLEEAMIADRLFLNGVNYCYESRYELKAADENNRLYKPDFCYPVIGLYHDHFALGII